MSTSLFFNDVMEKSKRDAQRARLIGAASSNDRRKDDFYATPPSAVAALLKVETFDGSVLEPACGDGAISLELERSGMLVRSTDLIDRGYGEHGIDFLVLRYPYRADNVITNPPFKLAEPFVSQALLISERKVAMLLKLAFLEGKRRASFLQTTPLARVWVFARRVTFRIPGNTYDRGGGMLAFAWFVWEHGHHGKPELGWLP
jgi:hypothetical protein